MERHTSPRSSRRAGLIVMALASTLALTGCPGTGTEEREPTRADFQRADALRTDPWLAPDFVQVTRYGYGSNALYDPGVARVYRSVDTEPVTALLAEVDAAAEVGWRPYYARCAGVELPLGSPEQYGAGNHVVALVRELDDGSLAQAVVTVEGEKSDGLAKVTVEATVANHDLRQPARPEVIDLDRLACARPVLPRAGAPTLGDYVDLTRW